jgi:biotin carboxyl carrier protein
VEIEINGRRRTVTLRAEGRGWIATLDGRRLFVDARPVDGRWSVLVGAAPDPAAGPALDPGETAGDVRRLRSYEVAVEQPGGGELVVHVNGSAFALTVPHLRGYAAASGGAAGLHGGPRRIVAALPGRVVKVLVTPGQTVEARQPLVIVEAMKMENEVRSPAAGTVASVQVAAGAPVEAGTLLLVLE